MFFTYHKAMVGTVEISFNVILTPIIYSIKIPFLWGSTRISFRHKINKIHIQQILVKI